MAAIATKRPATLAQVREVEGVGEAKAGKYGAAAIEIKAKFIESVGYKLECPP